MPSRAKQWALVALASLLPHLYGIRSPLLDYHHHRQTNTASIARNYQENGLHFLSPQISWDGNNTDRAATEFPLYMYLIGLLWNLGGLGELWGRILSVAFSALTALALMAFLKELVGERAALFAALLFSILPIEVYFGRTVQPEALALLCTVLCFKGLDLYLTAFESKVKIAAWLLACASAALAIGHKLPYLYLLGVCAALAWARLGRKALSDSGVLAFFPMVLTAVFAWYRYASRGVFVVPTKEGEVLSLLGYSRLPYFIQYQFLSRFPELTITLPGILLWIMGAAALKSRRKERFFLWCWLGCVAIHVIIGGHYAFSHEYTALPFVPVNAAFMGLGLDWWLRRGFKSRWEPALAASLLLAMPTYTAFRIKHWYRINTPFLLQAKSPVDRISSDSDLFLCNDRTAAFLYYIHRRGWAYSLEERGTDPLPWIREKMAQGAKFYLTAKAGAFLDPSNPLSKPIYANFPVAYDGDGILIFRLTPRPAAAPRRSLG